jgi:lipopolysaccharide assembly outer membrane protein LptD (OstA)
MTRLFLSIGILSVLGLAQTPTDWTHSKINPQVSIHAGSASATGSVAHLSGGVRIKTASMVLTADQADLNTETGEVTPQGNVHVTVPDLLNGARVGGRNAK